MAGPPNHTLGAARVPTGGRWEGEDDRGGETRPGIVPGGSEVLEALVALFERS